MPDTRGDPYQVKSAIAVTVSALSYERASTGGLERRTENPTVDVLDRLAATLRVPLSELFKKPRVGASPPKPLRSGRKALR